MDFIRNPIWTVIGTVASIISIMLFVYVERKNLFSQRFFSLERDTDKSYIYHTTLRPRKEFINSLKISFGVLLSAVIEIFGLRLGGGIILFWIWKIVFYIIIFLVLIHIIAILICFEFDLKSCLEVIVSLIAFCGPILAMLYLTSRYLQDTFRLIVINWLPIKFTVQHVVNKVSHIVNTL